MAPLFFAYPSRFLPPFALTDQLGSQDLDIADGDQGYAQKKNDSQCRTFPKAHLGKHGLIGKDGNRFGRIGWPSSGQGVNEIKYPKRIQRTKEQRNQNA